MRAEISSESEFTIVLPKPFGNLRVRYRDGRIRRVQRFPSAPGSARQRRPPFPDAARDKALESKLRADFLAYFSGRKVPFDYQVDTEGFTPFQKAVWAAMKEVPYGETRSYRWIAEKVGKPRAYRAVGNACGRNPVLIIQPCHRVVGSGGRLGGFSAGLDLKRALLQLEKAETR
jgi:methylated-DNA-[protein]-cysteine S-methyltransferase